ncbi:hypothetical protein VTJ49DRAFT_918 [Mycothermus thermophilus]|uniref:Uncharacterized protein n=1 Tax=Humicola insolens TaxID=85995 RepID=A0ABR3VFV8_HUMIN
MMDHSTATQLDGGTNHHHSNHTSPTPPPATHTPTPAAPAATAAATTTTTSIAAAAVAAASVLASDPWPAIESNYYASLREAREEEDRRLESDYQARAEPLRRSLVDNYRAQEDLLRRLQALRAEYDAASAELERLEGEVRTVKEERRRERAMEDEEKKRWFEVYRRGGLAYRANGMGTGKEGEGMVNGRLGAAKGSGMVRPEGYATPSSQALPAAEMGVDQGARKRVADAETENGALESKEKVSLMTMRVDKPTPAREGPNDQVMEDVSRSGEATLDGGISTVHRVGNSTAGETGTDSAAPGDGDAMDGVEAQGPTETDRGAQENAHNVPSNEPVQSTEPTDTEKHVEAAQPATAFQPENSQPPQKARDEDRENTETAPATSELSPQKEAPVPSVPVDAADMDTPMSDAPEPSAAEVKDESPAPAVPEVAPGSPVLPAETADPSTPFSTSSELSEPPVVETPRSLQDKRLPGATPNQDSPSILDVLDHSGVLVGRVDLVGIDNALVDRIRELPLKRPVQIRHGRRFTPEELNAVPRPEDRDTRAPRLLGLYIQATGEVQGKPCVDCAMSHGPFQGCVMLVGDNDFPKCANCEWSKRKCQGAALESPPGNTRRRLPNASPSKALAAAVPTREAASGRPGSAGGRPGSSGGKPGDGEGGAAEDAAKDSVRKGPRKSLPSTRKPLPSTPAAKPVAPETEVLPEITKENLCLKDDGVVFTDPPIMRGVPLEKISPSHPYWEPEWKPIEEIVEPLRQKHQEKFEQLEQSGSTHRDKHLANRDAKRGRTILKFLEDGELHPYQLVGKAWINHRITNYDTLFRLAQLLSEELPKFKLDVTPSQWLRHRIAELHTENPDKFDVGSWLAKAYHDRKIEQLREKCGFPRVGRPPAHAAKRDAVPDSAGSTGGGSARKSTAARSLKRKDPHQAPDATPSKPRITVKPPNEETETESSVPASQQQRPKKIRIITTNHPSLPTSTSTTSASDASPASSTKGSATGPNSAGSSSSNGSSGGSAKSQPKIILNSPFPPSATTEDDPHSNSPLSPSLESALEHDGYTSTDSISDDRLYVNDWRLHQVKTRAFATNPGVTQYWHWVTGTELTGAEPSSSPSSEGANAAANVIEHQVLESVRPVKWSVFKKPYNFHLRLSDIARVTFARGCTKVAVTHKKGRDGRDVGPRGDVLAMFKRERTKRRFLSFMGRERGVELREVSRDQMEDIWNSIDPEMLPGPDSD